MRDLHRDPGAIVHLIGEFAVVEPVEQPPHRLLGIGEDMVHVGGDHLGAIIARGLGQRLGAADAGGELGAQVGDVAVGIARRMRRRRPAGAHLRLAEMAFVDQQLIVDQHALVRRSTWLSGGIEPGAIPPMSAWWPRAATKADGSASSP